MIKLVIILVCFDINRLVTNRIQVKCFDCTSIAPIHLKLTLSHIKTVLLLLLMYLTDEVRTYSLFLALSFAVHQRSLNCISSSDRSSRLVATFHCWNHMTGSLVEVIETILAGYYSNLTHKHYSNHVYYPYQDSRLDHKDLSLIFTLVETRLRFQSFYSWPTLNHIALLPFEAYLFVQYHFRPVYYLLLTSFARSQVMILLLNVHQSNRYLLDDCHELHQFHRCSQRLTPILVKYTSEENQWKTWY